MIAKLIRSRVPLIDQETVVHTVTLPSELNERALQFAQSYHISINEVVAAALYSYFEGRKEHSAERSTLIFRR